MADKYCRYKASSKAEEKFTMVRARVSRLFILSLFGRRWRLGFVWG